LSILAARGEELLHQRLNCASRHEHAAIVLIQTELDAVPHDLRKALRQRRAIEHFQRNACTLMHLDALRDVRLAAAEEEQHSRWMEDRQAGTAGEPPPFVQGFPGEARVDFIAAVHGARHAGFPAGRSAGVGRTPRIEQQHFASELE
jgi:hypothetical protein